MKVYFFRYIYFFLFIKIYGQLYILINYKNHLYILSIKSSLNKGLNLNQKIILNMKFFNLLLKINIYILSFTSLFLYAEVKETESSVNLNFSGLQAEIYIDEGRNVLGIKEWSQYKTINSKNHQIYEFMFAVPDFNNSLEYRILSFKKLNGVKSNLFDCSDSINIQLLPAGKMRNIEISKLIISPFYFDKSDSSIYFIENIEIKISFSQKINLNLQSDLRNESVFFNNIENQIHLGSLAALRQIRKNKSDLDYLQANKWYNSEINYVKIETTEDEIVKFKISDVQLFIPEIIGKESKYLHLLNKGNEIPLLIYNDNGILESDDIIYFYGSRAKGDTTWFDSYSKYESFYLFYESSSEGLRFDEMENVNSSELHLTNSVTINRHYEKDLAYSGGSDYYPKNYNGALEKSNFNDPRTVMGEGWFWALISPKSTIYETYVDNFKYNLLLSPSDSDSEKLEIALKYRTNQDSIFYELKPDVMTYYDINFSVNGIFKKRDSITGYHFNSIKDEGNKSFVINGLNNIMLKVKQVYEETNRNVNIDYIEVKGKSKPAAFEDKLDFLGYSDKFKINPIGFISSKILAFDIAHHTFKEFSNSKKGYLFRTGGLIGDSIAGSVGIADSVIFTNKNGIHLLAYDITSKNYKYEYFTGENNLYNQFINSLPDGSPISILVISNSSLNADFQVFRSMGSKLIDEFEAGKVYSGAFIKSYHINKEVISSANGGFTDFIEYNSGLNYSFEIALNSNQNSNFLLEGFDNISAPANISKVNKTDLRNTEKIDVVIITHKNFISPALRLADYRSKQLGLKILTVDADDIYKEFGSGKKSPHAIKEFLKYSFENRNLQYVTIMGDASWDPRRVMAKSISTDWVPTYGFPASDWWYVCLDGENDLTADLIIGRIPVIAETQATDYVDKLIEYDNAEKSDWMKHFLFLLGPDSVNEQVFLSNLVNTYYSDNIKNPPMCGTLTKISKDQDGSSSSAKGTEIRTAINKGALWTIYIGHAAAEILALDGWQATSLNNKGKYGILSTVSCNSGAYAEPQLIASRNEQYLLVKDKGFVGVTGASFTGFVGQHNYIVNRMIESIVDTSKSVRLIGDLLHFGKQNLSTTQLYDRMTLSTYLLMGDPMVSVRIGTRTDLFITNKDVTLTNNSGSGNFSDKDENVIIKGKFFNYGYSTLKNFKLRIIRDHDNKSDTVTIPYSGACGQIDFNTDFVIKSLPGNHRFTIEIDPDNNLNDLDLTNNKLVINIYVFSDKLLALDPMPYWDISSENPRFRLINPFQDSAKYEYRFLISSDSDTSSVLYYGDSKVSNFDITVSENYIEWHPLISLPQGSYWFHTGYKNLSNNLISNWLSIPIHVHENFNNKKVHASIKSQEEFLSGIINNLSLTKSDEGTYLELKRDSLQFNALSVKGNNPNNPQNFPPVGHWGKIEVGGVVLLDAAFDLGFNVAAIKSDNGNLTKRIKRFETFGLEMPWPPQNYLELDTVSAALTRYLRDSIANDEYVIIVTSQSCFRMPILHKLFGEEGDEGSIDSVMYYLKQFGSKIADTLKFEKEEDGEHLSFAFMGWRNAEIGSAVEAIHFKGDSAAITGNIVTFSRQGNFETPLIQKAKKWNNLKIEGNYPDNGTLINITVLGLNSVSLQLDTLLKSNFLQSFDLNEIDSEIYHDIKATVNFTQQNIDINSLLINPPSNIQNLEFDFISADEIAITKSKTKFNINELMRGDKLEILSEVENISLRNDIDSLEIRINAAKSGIINNFQYVYLENLKADSARKISQNIVTDNLDYFNTVRIDADADLKINEFYKFNNYQQLNLNINRDTTKPTVILKIDNNPHKFNDYIGIIPTFEVELFDNSPLMITDSNSILVRVNGYLHPFQNTTWSEFISVDNGTKLKAIFRFRPDTLKFEDVSIYVYFSDNEGNRDTIFTMAKISLLNAFAEEVYTYPNPAESLSEIFFHVYFKAPMPGMNANIKIYDLNGGKIDEFNQSLNLGTNAIQWDRSRYKSSLSDGVYFYQINFSGDYYVDPVYGKFIITKE